MGAGPAVPRAAVDHLQRLQDRPLRRAARAAGDGGPAQAAAFGHRAALGAAGPRRRVLDRRRRRVRRGGHRHRGGWGGGRSRARRARPRGGLRRGGAALPSPQLRRQHGAGLRALLPAGVRPRERDVPHLRRADGGRLDGDQRWDGLPHPGPGAGPLVRGDGHRRPVPRADGGVLRAGGGPPRRGSGVAPVRGAHRRGDAARLRRAGLEARAPAPERAAGARPRASVTSAAGATRGKSTNLSYLPPALERGALLFTGLRAERVLLENGRAAGLEGDRAERQPHPCAGPRGGAGRRHHLHAAVPPPAGARQLQRAGGTEPHRRIPPRA